MRDRDGGGLHLPPRSQPGFAAALARGAVPAPPGAPPAILPGRCAAAAFRSFFVRGALVLAALLLALDVLPRLGLGTATTSVALLALSGLALAALHRQWLGVGRALMAELDAGYATLVLTSASFRPPTDPRWRATDGRVPWDFTGTWVLRPDGQVRSAPDRRVDPPGFYPCPGRPEVQELWSGAAWTGQLRH